MTIGRTFCVLVAALCMAAVGYAASYWYPLPQRRATQPAGKRHSPRPAENPTRIEAMGRMEPVSGTLTVGAIPGEEIVQLNAHVGKTVKKDDVLAVLGSQELRSEERVLAEQQLEKAKRQFEAEQALAKLRQDVAPILAGTGCNARERDTDRKSRSVSGKQRQELAEAQLARLEAAQERLRRPRRRLPRRN